MEQQPFKELFQGNVSPSTTLSSKKEEENSKEPILNNSKDIKNENQDAKIATLIHDGSDELDKENIIASFANLNINSPNIMDKEIKLLDTSVSDEILNEETLQSITEDSDINFISSLLSTPKGQNNPLNVTSESILTISSSFGNETEVIEVCDETVDIVHPVLLTPEKKIEDSAQSPKSLQGKNLNDQNLPLDTTAEVLFTPEKKIENATQSPKSDTDVCDKTVNTVHPVLFKPEKKNEDSAQSPKSVQGKNLNDQNLPLDTTVVVLFTPEKKIEDSAQSPKSVQGKNLNDQNLPLDTTVLVLFTPEKKIEDSTQSRKSDTDVCDKTVSTVHPVLFTPEKKIEDSAQSPKSVQGKNLNDQNLPLDTTVEVLFTPEKKIENATQSPKSDTDVCDKTVNTVHPVLFKPEKKIEDSAQSPKSVQGENLNDQNLPLDTTVEVLFTPEKKIENATQSPKSDTDVCDKTVNTVHPVLFKPEKKIEDSAQSPKSVQGENLNDQNLPLDTTVVVLFTPEKKIEDSAQSPKSVQGKNLNDQNLPLDTTVLFLFTPEKKIEDSTQSRKSDTDVCDKTVSTVHPVLFTPEKKIEDSTQSPKCDTDVCDKTVSTVHPVLFTPEKKIEDSTQSPKSVQGKNLNDQHFPLDTTVEGSHEEVEIEYPKDVANVNENLLLIFDASIKEENIYQSECNRNVTFEPEFITSQENIAPAKPAMENQEFRQKPRKSILSTFDPFYLSSPKTKEEDIRKSSGDLASITESAQELVTEIVECAFNTVVNSEYRERRIFISAKAMADVSDKLALQEEENADLKLQLNASQQVRATLELQLRQKEEIIIKSQAETLRKDQAFKQEVKQLKEKLEQTDKLENENSQTKDLQEMVKLLKSREGKILSELNARKNDEQNYKKIMDEYEKTLAMRLSEMQKLNEEHETVKRHLANLELAFSDVHQKYERSKKIIDGYKCNEDALTQTLLSSEDTVAKCEEKYESLKAHAKAQIEKSNQEMQLMRDQYESDIHKLSAIIKRLEIKNASLADSLDQKTKECSALAALCDEVTGKV